MKNNSTVSRCHGCPYFKKDSTGFYCSKRECGDEFPPTKFDSKQIPDDCPFKDDALEM